MNILKTILEITIYSGVIFGITVLFKKFLKNKISPALHLGIWLIFIMRLILPVTFESSVHFFTIQETAIQQQAGIDSMTVQEIDEKQIEPVQQIQVSVNNNLPALNENPIAQNAVKPAANEQDTPVIQSNIPEKQSKSTNFKIDTGSLILTVWVAGIGVFVMYHIYIYCCLLKRVRKNAIRPSNDLHELFENCKQELGISGNIHLTVQENLHSPACQIFEPG